MRREPTKYPKSVCLETYSLCNGSCVFCPYTTIDTKAVKMDSSVVYRLIDELALLKIERFSLFNNNEPLLDDNVFEYIHYAKQRMPNVRQTLSSNGKVLTVEKIVQAVESGIDRFFISIPTVIPEEYARIMGGNLFKVLEVIDDLPKQYYPNIRIAVPKTRYFSYEGYENVFGKKGVKYIVWDMELNATWHNASRIKEISEINFEIGCDRPLDQMIISSNGDVLLCCRDWFHDNVIGNIHENSLKSIWNSLNNKKYQELLASGKYSEIYLCQNCSRVCNRGE